MFEQEQKNTVSSDVVFKFSDGSVLYAHRNILCSRCDFFKTMMTGRWKESQPPYKVLEESDPRLFKEFIRYLYCGKVHVDSAKDLIRLYSIAEAKCQSPLLNWLSDQISENATTENACEMLQMLHDTCDQTTKCFKNTFSEIKDVLLSDINSLEKGRICELEMEILVSVLRNQKFKNQKQLFEAVMVWVNNCTTLSNKWKTKIFELEPLMATIDFKSMNRWYFTDNVVPLNVLSPAVFSNIVFRFNVEAAGESFQKISDAKWRCIIPFDISKTSKFEFSYKSRQFYVKYIPSERHYISLYFENDGTHERIKCKYTMIHTSTDNKLHEFGDAIYNLKNCSKTRD
ncbi:Btbd9, partial [Acrasis kona]